MEDPMFKRSARRNGSRIIIKEARSRVQKEISWQEAIDRYELFLKARAIAKETKKHYRLDIQNLFEHFDALDPQLKPGDLRIEHLRAYQCGLLTGETARRRKPLTPATVSRITTGIMNFFLFLHDE